MPYVEGDWNIHLIGYKKFDIVKHRKEYIISRGESETSLSASLLIYT